MGENKRYILYVRDKNSDNNMRFEYGSKEELVYYASECIKQEYEEVRAVIEKAPQGVQSCQGNIKNNIRHNCNTIKKIKKVRLINNDDYRELIRFLDGVQTLVLNSKYELVIDMLEHKKKVLQDKIEEVE